MSLTGYLASPQTEKILLAEIDATGTPIRLADAPYITEPDDIPASAPYHPIIRTVPRLARNIQDLWGGRTSATWGPLELATVMAGAINLATGNLRGKAVSVLITGPRASVARAEAITVLTGMLGESSGDVDAGMSINIYDGFRSFAETALPPNVYDSAVEGGNFPTANHGKTKPLCLGKCRNVSPVLVDGVSYTYQVNDGAVLAIDAVYDDGVSVSFTPAPAAGKFTLAAAPVGTITADVRGATEGANHYEATGTIIDYLARQYGGLPGGAIDILGLPAETVGIYLDTRLTLAGVITRLMRGVLGWWGFTRAGSLRARLMSGPVSAGVTYDATSHCSPITWADDPAIHYHVPYLYQRNWTRIDQPGGVSQNQASWLSGDGYEDWREDVGISAAYPTSTMASRLETYFDAAGPAGSVADRALTLFGTARRTARVSVPQTDPPVELGDSVILAGADYLDGSWLVIGATDRWDGEVPLVDLALWA